VQSSLPRAILESKILTKKITKEQAKKILNPSNNGYRLEEIYSDFEDDETRGSEASDDGVSKQN